MKTIHFRKTISLVLAVMLTMFLFTVYAGASNITDYQSSVVCIGATIQFTASNYNVSFSSSATGTGFAVGLPGEPVQYVATCAHVVYEPAGIYTILVDKSSGRLLDFDAEPEGTYYPASYEETVSGVECILIRDYFNTEAVDLYALFSNSSNDYITMTITQMNPDVDLAVCKLASTPTTKISALPLQLKGTVDINTDVLAIGYPSTSRVLNAENRLDASDSTVKDGIVSRLGRIPSRTSSSQETFDAFEVTAELITGMSGGPVISEDTGAVVGVTSFGYIDVSQAAAARYAICIDYLIPMLDVEGIPYQIGTDNSFGSLPLILIIAAVLLVAVGVIVAVSMKKKPAAPAPAPAPVYDNIMKFHLNGIAGYHNGKRYGGTGTVVIGRDNTRCNVLFPLDQPGVSGVHCELRISGKEVTLKDCNSSYGTYLENGTKLTPNVPVVLHNGSRFYVGSTNNMFEVEY